MAPSPTPPEDLQLIPVEGESQLSSLVFDMSQKVQAAMENMLRMTNEIDQNSAEVVEDIEKCKDAALERKKNLEEEKERVQKAAYTILEMLNKRG